MPMVLRYGAQSQEYWYAALRLCAYSNGILFLLFCYASCRFVDYMSTYNKLIPSSFKSYLVSFILYYTKELFVLSSYFLLILIVP